MELPDHIHLSQLRQSPELLREAEAFLSPEERDRLASFRSSARRESFALGRHAARTLLASAMDCAPSAVDLAVQENGSIAVPGSSWQLSISHSATYAAAAISQTELGIDLEQIKSRPESLFRFVLHPEEMGLRDSVDLPTDLQIVLFWSLKEAVLKAKRTGLRRSPKSLRLRLDLGGGRAVISGDRTWQARFEIRRDHVLSVCWLAGAYQE